MLILSFHSLWIDLKSFLIIFLVSQTHCLTNIPFSLARRIYTIVENENVKEKHFKELKRTLLEQKYPKSLIEASILRAKGISEEETCQIYESST